MLSGLLGLAIFGAVVAVPLAWRVRDDRRRERALAIRAQAHAALRRALGGESLVALQAEPPTLWRPGRLVLSAPTDWQRLLEPAWSAVVAHVPPDYELVVRLGAPARSPSIEEDLALRAA